MVDRCRRIYNHTILGPLDNQRKKIKIIVDNKEIEAFEGETIVAALIAAGIKVFHITSKRNEPRGYYCAIGVCNDCVMTVNGKPNVRTCVTQVSNGMKIETQVGRGKWSYK